MDEQRWHQVEELFHAVLELSPEAREPFLETAGGEDPELKREVRQLVDSFEGAEGESREAVVTEPRASGLTAGSRLGAYQIDGELSSGGMGSVYIAHRADQAFEKKVAIKIIRSGMDNAETERRFRTERQILAGLEHPNIARLLDGGATPEGQPFLVMEYIDGPNVLDYCRTNGLTVAQKLDLFLKICDAVQYAHQHLVIHRDLKPNNILIGSGGEPKLLDFGIAKLIDTDASQTATELAFFSPLYASPEQLKNGKASTATDVYSLGVVLYEMLAGTRPYRLESTSPAEVMAAILLQDPLRPSWHVKLPAELDEIVLKALRKEPRERYGSVEQLGEDVSRYLEGRPVLARQGTWLYYTSKFIRRNRLAAFAVAMLALAIAAGVGATLWEAREAKQAQARAERRFLEVRKLANYLVFDFQSAVRQLPGSTLLQKQVFDKSLEYLDRLAGEASGDSGLQLELAEAYLRMADVQGSPTSASLGLREKALESYSKALSVIQPVLASDPKNAKARKLAAEIRAQSGGVMAFAGKHDEGIGRIRQGVNELEALVKEFPGDAELRLSMAKALEALGTQIVQQGGLIAGSSEGSVWYQRSIENLQAALKIDPSNGRVLRELAVVEVRSANMAGSVNPNAAIAGYRRAQAALDRLPAEQQDLVENRDLRGQLHVNISWALGQINSYREALEEVAKGEVILGRSVSLDPQNTSALYRLSAVYRTAGIICGYAKDNACAIHRLEQAAAAQERLIALDASNVTYRALLGELQMRLADLLTQGGHAADARARAAAGLKILRELASSPKASATQLEEACRWLHSTEVKELRDVKAAVSYCERSAALTGNKNSLVLERLAYARDAVGDRKGAVDAIEKALALLPKPALGQPRSRQLDMLEKQLASWRK